MTLHMCIELRPRYKHSYVSTIQTKETIHMCQLY